MNMFKLLGNLGNLAKMQQEVQSITEELAELTFEGKAGAGLVAVTVNGSQQLVSCSIEPKLIEDNDRELIEELVVAAANDAINRSKKESAEQLQRKLSERLNLPDMSGLMSAFMPKG